MVKRKLVRQKIKDKETVGLIFRRKSLCYALLTTLGIITPKKELLKYYM
jgi:hypothetical protein